MDRLAITELDKSAWDAICTWPGHAGMDVVRDSLDWGHLTRSLLWDKVGRALRGSVGEWECGSGGRRHESERPTLNVQHRTLNEDLCSPGLAQRVRCLALNAKLALERRLSKTAVLYCPFPYSRNARILDTLLGADRDYEIIVPAEHEHKWPGAIPNAERGIRLCFATPRQVPNAEQSSLSKDESFARQLHEAMKAGVKKCGVDLLDDDSESLLGQIHLQLRNVRNSERQLERLRPDAILVPVDNCSPFIEMVLVARRMGIPTIMLQHGLDCERYYLDEAYASHIAVWGDEHRKRYSTNSEYQPEAIEVIGNPGYDDLPIPDVLSTKGCYWLWVTRPHIPDKCYAPSRSPDEGMRILNALLDALSENDSARLVVKAHTFDYRGRYVQRIQERGMHDRVRVPDDALFDLLRDASLVVSEDSTAGMDAMMMGKVVIHAHFAAALPAMPFVEYGAALPGFSAAQLARSLRAAGRFAEPDLMTLQKNQRRFLRDFAGPVDGRAAERFVQFVGEYC